VQKRIGEGSFGEVRKAIDRLTGATVALKSIRSTGMRGARAEGVLMQLRSHFRAMLAGIPRAAFRELTILRQLDHYRVIRVAVLGDALESVLNSAVKAGYQAVGRVSGRVEPGAGAGVPAI
jgi:serine/threonine protein kinase